MTPTILIFKEKKMGFWFDKKETFEKHTEPYVPAITLEEMRQISFSKDFQAELYDSDRVLFNLQGMLLTMLMNCRRRKSKKMVLSEEDFYLLYKIASKEIQIKR